MLIRLESLHTPSMVHGETVLTSPGVLLEMALFMKE